MKHKITKSNSLINASYRLSLNELRIVLYGLSFVNPLDEEFPLIHRFSIKELADFYGIGNKDRGSFYDNIKQALVSQFWKREFTYYDEESKEIVSARWLIEIRYGRKDGTLAYHYNPLIKKELKNLSRRFTSYFLSNVANMKSAYSIRFYEMFVMYLNASKSNQVSFQISIDELKTKLDIRNKYKNLYDFKRRVLNKAKEEIDKLSDINVSYQVIKIGRIPINIKFIVCTNKTREEKEGYPSAGTDSHKVSSQALEKAKQLVVSANVRWDMYAIVDQFYSFIKSKGEPDNIDGAFIGFVKKKIVQPPR